MIRRLQFFFVRLTVEINLAPLPLPLNSLSSKKVFICRLQNFVGGFEQAMRTEDIPPHWRKLPEKQALTGGGTP